MSLHTKIIISTLIIISSLILATSASALGYRSDPITLDFTFGSTLSITTDGNITIPNLTPGAKAISRSDYVVTVDTNNASGYTLSATIGCSSAASNYGASCTDTNKLLNSSDNDSTTNSFTMVAMNNGATTGTTLTPGTWGVSFDSTATEDSAFESLPLYSTVARIINQTINTIGASAPMGGNPTIYYPGTNNTTVRIGAYATTSQLAGTYTNTINFIAIANTVPLVYMQDLTLSQCQVNVGTNGNPANIGDNITVVDRRDNNIYTVRYINGLCWMTQNLRIVGTISSQYSNFDRVSSFNVSEYDLTDVEHCANDGATADNPLGYTNVCSHFSKDSSGNPTAWYNYPAATAGQITGIGNTTLATQDICPSGWHLPSGPSTTENTDFNKLVGTTGEGYQAPTIGFTSFNAIAGGYYRNGIINETVIGEYWSTTAYVGYSRARYYLGFYSSIGRFYGTDGNTFSAGIFVRCVKSE